MKGLISIWLTLRSILDGIKGSIQHHSKSLQHWNVWLKWARRPAQPNPTEWGNSARDIGHCTLICKWALVWSLPGGQAHYLQETRIRPSTQPQLHSPLQRHLGSGHLYSGTDAWDLPTMISGVTLIRGHSAVSQGRTAELRGEHDERMSWNWHERQ